MLYQASPSLGARPWGQGDKQNKGAVIMGFIFVALMIVLVSVENDSFHETPVLDFLTWVNRSYLHTVVKKIVLSSYFLPEDTPSRTFHLIFLLASQFLL